ncbi:MAG: hypothetical protein ACC652_01140 [Acidimicrobiales bacterium]
MSEYENRQDWDLDAWPEMYDKVKDLMGLIFLSPPGVEINLMVFTVTSRSSDSRHCQAHGAYGLDHAGLALDKVQALWSFESSGLFDERERAALRFAAAAGANPNAVNASHHADLRVHYTDEEVRTLLGVIGVAGFMNRYNDSLATVTDEASVTWAEQNIAQLGWDIGKHVGAVHEQRTGPPF